ncbi:uncharacterized protein [Acropora muricata]|uniref:uncharacterized protein n=1 Tax=Acropora muricata TaxID=159855 RepID=UPI0034E4A7CF
MASVLIWFGRFAFFVLYGLQSYSLTSYPAVYNSNAAFYALIILFTPALGLWIWILCDDKNLKWLFVVWLAYVWFALIPLIGIIFGGDDPIENKLNSEAFFGPNVLKMTLCVSPLLLLLLLSTGTDSMSYRDLIWLLSLRIALDLFDSVEMLEVVLEENIVHHNISKECEVVLEEIIVPHNIPRSFENAIIAFACISFILSPLELMQVKTNDYGQWKYRKVISCAQRTAQTLLVNCVFLSLRLALFRKYGRDASIFIAKNGIIILLSLFEICSRFKCCGCEERY